MRRGENPSEVLARVQAAVEELNSGMLPKGVVVKNFYDRTFLIQNTLHTVAHSVTLGITLVVLVLLLFLGRPSMAALVALTIPFSLLVALLLMYVTKHSHRAAFRGGDRLRHHRRRRGHHGREHRPPPRRLGPRADATECQQDDPGRRAGSRAAGLLLGADDHRRLPAAAFAGEHRGAVVPADGPDAGVRASGGVVFRPVRGARAGHVPLPPRLPGIGRTRCSAGSGPSMRPCCGGCWSRGGWWPWAWPRF